MHDGDIKEAAGYKAIDTESESSNNEKVKNFPVMHEVQICMIESKN